MNEDKSQKIFPPTPHKLREARKKGQVPKSTAITSAAGLLSTLGALLLLGGWMTRQIMAWTGALVDQSAIVATDGLAGLLFETLRLVALVCAPVVLVAFVAAVLGNVAQFGIIFSVDPVKPKMQNINPIQGAKKMFSRAKFTELLNSCIKIVVIMLVAALVFRYHVRNLVLIQYHDIEAAIVVGGAIILKILAALVPLFIVLAAIDYAIKRAEFMREQRMSRYERKQEFKNTQGSPEMKQERRKRNYEDIENDLRAAAAHATVMVTDGFRLIALRWHEQDCPVPMVTLYERGKRGKQATDIAARKGVVVVDNADALVAMWPRCKPNHPVPVSLYGVVAPLIRQGLSGGG